MPRRRGRERLPRPTSCATAKDGGFEISTSPGDSKVTSLTQIKLTFSLWKVLSPRPIRANSKSRAPKTAEA